MKEMKQKAATAPPIDTGISKKDRAAISDGLSKLLADNYTLYLKTHNFHWNVTGPMFNTLHLMFETQYNELWLANDQIAERIRKHYRSISASRAQTIARTEVHAAANYGSLMTAAEQREPMRKIWLATPDGLTRDAHQEMHGQTRLVGEPFTHEGDKLMYPGDSSFGAPGELTVNCRCSLGFERVRRPLKPAKPRRVA